ncbi:unnamed protein product [Urochloa humidicola]
MPRNNGREACLRRRTRVQRAPPLRPVRAVGSSAPSCHGSGGHATRSAELQGAGLGHGTRWLRFVSDHRICGFGVLPGVGIRSCRLSPEICKRLLWGRGLCLRLTVVGNRTSPTKDP